MCEQFLTVYSALRNVLLKSYFLGGMYVLVLGESSPVCCLKEVAFWEVCKEQSDKKGDGYCCGCGMKLKVKMGPSVFGGDNK